MAREVLNDSDFPPGAIPEDAWVPWVQPDGTRGKTAGSGVGGGGGGSPFMFDPPLAADFSLLSTDANNLGLTDGVTGLQVEGGPLSSAVGRFAYKTLSDKTLDWRIEMGLRSVIGAVNSSTLGIFLRDSVGGKVIGLGPGYAGSVHKYELNNYTNLSTWSANVYTINMSVNDSPYAYAIERIGSTLYYYASFNGETWSLIGSNGVTSFLGAAPDQVGFAVNIGRTTGSLVKFSVPYFSLTGPAV